VSFFSSPTDAGAPPREGRFLVVFSPPLNELGLHAWPADWADVSTGAQDQRSSRFEEKRPRRSSSNDWSPHYCHTDCPDVSAGPDLGQLCSNISPFHEESQLLPNSNIITTPSTFHDQGFPSSPGFLPPNDFPGPIPTGNSFGPTSIGDLFGEHFHSPVLDEDLDNTGIGSFELEAFHNSGTVESAFTTAAQIHSINDFGAQSGTGHSSNPAIPIPHIGSSGTQMTPRYHCTVSGCDVSTKRQDDLRRHMKLHSDRRRTCQFCLKQFADRTDKFKSHLKLFHKFDADVLRNRRDLWE
jgi:hypothetical protein